MTRAQSLWHHGVKTGAIGGITVLVIALVGMVESFNKRFIIADVMTMGIALVIVVAVLIAYNAAKRAASSDYPVVFATSVSAALITSGFLAMLVIIGNLVNLRSVLVNASPALYMVLTAGFKGAAGVVVILVAGGLSGVFAGILYLMPQLERQVTIVSLGSVLIVGLLQDLIRPVLTSWGPVAVVSEWLFTQNGLTITGSIVILVIIAAIFTLWALKRENIKTGYGHLSGGTQRNIKIIAFIALAVFLIVLPHLLGLFLSEVLTIVGLYILLGLGLNIVVGYAGMLDLGYVAFFAIGAYTTAVALGILFGIILGVPVLKMRGDYLAIATLGFGEIIRILVLSDFLKPWLGGAQGAGKIPNPVIAGYQIAGPQHIYYLILAGCLLVVFISLRLRDSRLGRAWMAMREDEDVAQAMGINLVATKLLAFATGAGFSALSGAIFVSKIGSVYPHSFNVMISINVICLIIVGGIGSIPGVIVGAAALVGLPELLREFAEYRLFVYGAVLVAMMLLRPEGLWPEARHKLELRKDENDMADTQAETAA
jgi:branched-chain amino acid transport system permease protein